MPLRDDVETARDRALTALRDSHDYFTYTVRSWRIIQGVVRRKGLSFTLRNQVTGSTVTERERPARAQLYVEKELSSATLQQFVSIFEQFLLEVLRLWLRAHPEPVAARQIKGEQVLSLPDRPAIIDFLIDKELGDVLYDRPVNWFKYLNLRVNLGFPPPTDVQQFAEVKATRDILVHGTGVANAMYLEKAGPAARVRIGQPLDVPEPYHRASWDLIYRMVREIGTGMAAKA